MSVWKPSEGLRRGADIMIEIEAAIRECGAVIPYPQMVMVRYRVTDMLAKAIDQALTDGAEMDALAAMVGKNGHAEDFSGVTDLPEATADPVGFPSLTVVQGDKVYGAPDGPHETIAGALGAIDKASKKKRGRPKGAKGKKKAKKAKAAPVAEAVPAPPAGELGSG